MGANVVRDEPPDALYQDGPYQRVLRALPQAVVTTDLDGVVTFLNPAAEALYARPAGEAVGRPFAELVEPGAGAAVGRSGEWTASVAGAVPRSLRVTSSPVPAADGTEGGVLHVATVVSAYRDVTRLRTAAAVIDGCDDAIIEVDLGGVVRLANPAVEAVYGYRPADLIGRPVDVLMPGPGEARAVIDAFVAAVLAGESPDAAVVTCCCRNGSPVVVSVRLSAVRDEDGAVVGVASISRDVSADARVRAQLELSERRSRARFAQTSLPQAMISMDGRLVEVNDAMCELLGWGRDLLEGASMIEWQDEDGVGHLDERLAAVLAGERETDTWERLTPAEGDRSIPVLVHATLLREADGTPYGVASFVQDLTGLHSVQRALSRQEALTAELARGATDWAMVLDAAGVAQYISPAISSAFGWHPADVKRLGWEIIYHKDLPAVRQAFLDVLAEPGRTSTVQFRVRNRAGELRWVEDVFTNRLDHPEIAGVVCNGRDVTDQVRAARALRESESRYRAIAETAQEGIWAAELGGRTWYANQKVADILGIDLEEVYAVDAPALLDPGDATGLVDKLRLSQAHGPAQFEIDYRRPDGVARILRANVAPLTDDIGRTGLLVMVSDVTDARRAEQELQRRALRDELTGLANRALMNDRYEQALARWRRSGTGTVAMIFADLDQFKFVNDSWGHSTGDALLVQVAARLDAAVRGEDTVARFGGDEFVVVCEHATEAAATRLAHRLQDTLTNPFDVDGHRLYVTASIGVAASPPHSAPDLLRFAEAAMYEAKGRGPGRVAVFDAALAAQAADRLALGNDLRDALRHDGLELVYQPIVELSDGRLLGVEALARWSHPVRGAVSPAEFVAVAESSGLAPALDRWALGRAARDAERLAGALTAPPRIAVNISARHLTDPDFEDTVLGALRGGVLSGEGLTLEITETAVMDNPEQAVHVLRRLAEHGVQAALDDFGTGYSSLGYLKRLPVGTLKIDRSFVKDITTAPDALAITSAVLKLARTMRLKVVAEGIETVEQLSVLRRLGCTAGQGFLFSPGVSPEKLVDLVAGLPQRRFDVTVPDADFAARSASTRLDRTVALQ